jgi:hypothetical protein
MEVTVITGFPVILVTWHDVAVRLFQMLGPQNADVARDKDAVRRYKTGGWGDHRAHS